jgi:hypothetical protein
MRNDSGMEKFRVIYTVARTIFIVIMDGLGFMTILISTNSKYIRSQVVDIEQVFSANLRFVLVAEYEK